MNKKENETFMEIEELEAFFTLNLDLLCIAETSGYFVKVNKAWTDTLGYSQEELLNTPFLEFIHPDDHETTINAVETLKSNQNVINFVNRFRMKDGNYRHIEWRSVPMGAKIYAAARDITEKMILSEKLASSERLLRQLMDTIPVSIFWKDANYKYLGSNKQFNQAMGVDSQEELIGKTDYQMNWKALADFYRADDRFIIETGETKLNFEEKIIDEDGRERWVRTSKIPLYDNDLNVTGMMGMFEDITIQKMAALLIEESYERYNQLAALSRSMAFELNAEGLFTYINPVVEDVLGYMPEEIIGNMYFYDFSSESEREIFKNFGMDVLENCKHVSDFEHKLQHRDGHAVWVLTNGECVTDAKGQVSGFRGIDIDISRIKESEEKILWLSFHDQLTGLYNRRFFEEELQRLDTQRNYPLSVIMIDVNGLKLMNDAFGHEAGDQLLKKVGTVLKQVCRSDDIVARLGGDEFIVLLPSTPQKTADQIVTRIVEAAKKEKVAMLEVSLSCGRATKESAEMQTSDLILVAENRMYADKNKNKSKIRKKRIEMILCFLHNEISVESTHARRVSAFCKKIGEKMGLSKADLETLETVGFLHDIGKIGVDKAYLTKPASLTETEYSNIKRHSEIGYSVLSTSPDYLKYAEDVLHHHEHYNGTGYPRGLSGEDIPLFSRIICVADAYEAMTSERPYRKAMDSKEALNVLKSEKGRQFDPQIVDLFIKEKIYLEEK